MGCPAYRTADGWDMFKYACPLTWPRTTKARLGALVPGVTLKANQQGSLDFPFKIRFAHLKHGFFHQNKAIPPFTRQCLGLYCKDPCSTSLRPVVAEFRSSKTCRLGFGAIRRDRPGVLLPYASTQAGVAVHAENSSRDTRWPPDGICKAQDGCDL